MEIVLPDESKKSGVRRLTVRCSSIGNYRIVDETAEPLFGKKAAIYQVVKSSALSAARFRLLEGKNDRRFTEAQWRTIDSLHRRFPDIVLRPEFNRICGELVVEVCPWVKETFEEWAVRKTRPVEKIIQAIREIVEKFDRLNNCGFFHRDSHGNNVMRCQKSGGWVIIDWDDLQVGNLKGNLFDSAVFLAFAVLILEEEFHWPLVQFLKEMRHSHPFNYKQFKKRQDNAETADFYRRRVAKADAILSRYS